MTTILLSGVGALGGWALEFLARSPGIDRIVTVKRTSSPGPSRATLAMLGSVFQGHTKRFEHHTIDLANTAAMAKLLAEVRPTAILHSATVQSPRKLMNAAIDPGLRVALRSATFGMWLPWHLLPATKLIEAVDLAGIETKVVNAAFPDVVNPAIWRRFGHGPVAGAGNSEICAAQILRYAVDVAAPGVEDVEVYLVGSHALLGYGPAAGVPHHFRLFIEGRDVTHEHDLETILSWPEPIQWSKSDVFSLFAASAVKNTVALVGSTSVRTHLTGPNGLPGGYPVRIDDGGVRLELPDGLDRDAAVAINEKAARWDGIDHIEPDGTVVYTRRSKDAMAELGYRIDSVRFDDLADQSQQLMDLVNQLTTREETHA